MADEAKVWKLAANAELRLMTREDFEPHYSLWHTKIFDARSRFFAAYSEDERAKIKGLREHMGAPLNLRFGIFCDGEFAGWHIGEQRSAVEYYMRNSAVVPEFRRRGLYAAMVRTVLDYLKDLGFQEIGSRHTATNNAVIIPKLREGFVINGFELSDTFGTLVTLKWFASAERRKVMDYRSGEIPYAEVKGLLQG